MPTCRWRTLCVWYNQASIESVTPVSMFKQSIDLPERKQKDSHKVVVAIHARENTSQELVGAGGCLVPRGKESFRISDILNTGNTENSRLTPTQVTWRTERVFYFFFLYWDQEDHGKRSVGIQPSLNKISGSQLELSMRRTKGYCKMWTVVCSLIPGFQFSNLGQWLRTCISRKSPDHLDAASRVPHLRWVLSSRGTQELL